MTGADMRKRDERGFTLMELLVVLGIFSIVVTAASDIFMLVSRSQRKVFSLERTQSDARYTMEAMAREIRTGEIDYDFYVASRVDGRPALPEQELALIDSAGTPMRFALSSDAEVCTDAASMPCLAVIIDGGAPVSITPKGVAVTSLGFYVSPGVDPGPDLFNAVTGEFAADEQPRVTIAMTLEAAGRREEMAVLRLQTTVINRRYSR